MIFIRYRPWLLGAVITGLGVALVSTLLLRDTWRFVANLSGRGIQVESVMPLPWRLRQAFGDELDAPPDRHDGQVLPPRQNRQAPVQDWTAGRP